MLGVKLRSDRVDTYDELGERGQPVYRVAPQILEVLRRQREYPDLAKHYAVPQANDNGTMVDWYAPEQGEVIPWSSATPEEQQSMQAQLVRAESVLKGIADQIRTEDATGDRRLFGALLHWVSFLPDHSYVYLVNQRAVVCFWGFLHAGADRSRNPLHFPEAVSQSAPSIPLVAEDVPVPLAPVASPAVPLAEPAPDSPPPAPWWKRWWMWLLLALLLLLLLFGLRSCLSPSALPKFALPDMTPSLPDFKVDVPRPDLPALATQTPGFSMPSLPTMGSMPSIGAPEGSVPLPDPASSVAATLPPANSDPVPAGATPATQAEAGPSAIPPPAVPNPPDAAVPPASIPSQSPGGSPGAGLTIPAGAKDGRADFLNGHWRAGAGIQDRATGAPLRLEYQFEKGEGHVVLRRHNGVECKAPTSASMANGALSLTNSSQAACSDGTAYELPKVECSSSARESAQCQGSYGDARFPMSMRQAHP